VLSRQRQRAERAPAAQVEQLDAVVHLAADREPAAVRRERVIGDEVVAQKQRAGSGTKRVRPQPQQPRPAAELFGAEQRPVGRLDRPSRRVDGLQVWAPCRLFGGQGGRGQRGADGKRQDRSHARSTPLAAGRFRRLAASTRLGRVRADRFDP